jgi:hypothetical protein
VLILFARKPIAWTVGLLVVAAAAFVIRARQDAEAVDGASNAVAAQAVAKPLTMADVLEVATDVRAHMAETVDDYTLRFIKQDRDTSGVLQEQETLLLKVQSPTEKDGQNQSLRVYLEALAPESKKGQEVIWSEDLFDGKLCAHLAGIMGLKRMYVKPTSIFAMVGQRHPISEIGMAKLVETLIQRGKRDREDPNITIARVPDFQHGDVTVDLYQITCSKPRGGDDDFSYSEVAFDRERMLLLIFRTFGWPENEGEEAPLLESYAYHDVKLNVGLTDEDFNPDNPDYNFPKY